jgi:hypothetical protein
MCIEIFNIVFLFFTIAYGVAFGVRNLLFRIRAILFNFPLKRQNDLGNFLVWMVFMGTSGSSSYK